MAYGKPGPGKWITLYANGGHVYMDVAGIRFDTSAADRATTSAAGRTSCATTAASRSGTRRGSRARR